jgi:hypothetical protein
MVNTYEKVRVEVVDTHTVGTYKGTQPCEGVLGSREDKVGQVQIAQLILWMQLAFSEPLSLTWH